MNTPTKGGELFEAAQEALRLPEREREIVLGIVRQFAGANKVPGGSAR